MALLSDSWGAGDWTTTSIRRLSLVKDLVMNRNLRFVNCKSVSCFIATQIRTDFLQSHCNTNNHFRLEYSLFIVINYQYVFKDHHFRATTQRALILKCGPLMITSKPAHMNCKFFHFLTPRKPSHHSNPQLQRLK